MGDFNIDLLKYDSCKYSKEFLNSLNSCTFFPTITKPTRVYGNSATLIDNIFLNNLEYSFVSGNIVSNINDNFSQVCIVNNCKVINNFKKRKIRDYSKFNKNRFLSELENINLQHMVQQSSNSDRAFSTFYNKLNK